MSALTFCLVSTFYPPHSFGGDAVHVERLANGLAARGHRVRVVHNPAAYTMTGGESPAHATRPSGVEVVADVVTRNGTLATYLTGRPVGYRAGLERAMAGADVVHFHNPSLLGGPGALALPDALRVYTTHEHWLLCPMHVLFRNNREVCTQRTCWRCTVAHRRPPQLWRSTNLLRHAVGALDALLCPSEFTAARHRDAFPDAPIEVLRLPAPAPDTVERALHAPREDAPARPYFVFAGRLEPIKGPVPLVRAFGGVHGADLLVVGDGGEAAAVRDAAAGNPRVHVLGKVAYDDLLVLLRDALAVVVPSVGYETFGGVAVEAMALGTPALVRDLGALPELVAGGGGTTFRDDEDLRAAMQRLVDDGALAARLGREAAALYEPAASDERFFRRYFELLAAAARRSRPQLVGALEAATR